MSAGAGSSLTLEWAATHLQDAYAKERLLMASPPARLKKLETSWHNAENLAKHLLSDLKNLTPSTLGTAQTTLNEAYTHCEPLLKLKSNRSHVHARMAQIYEMYCRLHLAFSYPDVYTSIAAGLENWKNGKFKDCLINYQNANRELQTDKPQENQAYLIQYLKAEIKEIDPTQSEASAGGGSGAASGIGAPGHGVKQPRSQGAKRSREEGSDDAPSGESESDSASEDDLSAASAANEPDHLDALLPLFVDPLSLLGMGGGGKSSDPHEASMAAMSACMAGAGAPGSPSKSDGTSELSGSSEEEEEANQSLSHQGPKNALPVHDSLALRPSLPHPSPAGE